MAHSHVRIIIALLMMGHIYAGYMRFCHGSLDVPISGRQYHKVFRLYEQLVSTQLELVRCMADSRPI